MALRIDPALPAFPSSRPSLPLQALQPLEALQPHALAEENSTEKKTNSTAQLFFASPLMLALTAFALGFAISTLAHSFCTLAFTAVLVVGLSYVISPDILPKKLVYEIAILDLYARHFFSEKFPCLCNQKWWHEIRPNLILGGIPLKNRQDDEKLVGEMRVSGVVTVLEDFELSTVTWMSEPLQERDWQRRNVECLRINSEDMKPIALESMERAVEFIHRKASEDHGKVYVHCKSGRGRSASVVICYLMKYEYLSLEKAITEVQSIRSTINLLPQQMENLRAYERGLHPVEHPAAAAPVPAAAHVAPAAEPVAPAAAAGPVIE